mgnify:CR=1 FL=1
MHEEVRPDRAQQWIDPAILHDNRSGQGLCNHHKAATDNRYILLSRRISEGEWFQAVSLLEELGMEEGFMQEFESASLYYRPDFTDEEKPFKDIRDFVNN